MAGRIAFADEAGIDGSSRCYAIGVVSVDAKYLVDFERAFLAAKSAHGVNGEVHWKRIDKSHGAINFALDWLHRIIKSKTARFDTIVVNTRQYRKWRE